MGYLERNQRILAEAQAGWVINPGKRHVADRGTAFSPAGQFSSEVIGRIIYVGLKYKYGYGHDSYQMRKRLCEELAIVSLIADSLPNLEAPPPSFHGLLIDPDGQDLAIATEDFSEGGRLVVLDHKQIPPELEQFLERGGAVFRVQLERIAFRVEQTTRLGDFDGLGYATEEYFERVRNIEENLDRYTIRTQRADLEGLLYDWFTI